MSAQILTGNAAAESSGHKGWILGHFMPPSSALRHSTDVEIKWGIHQPGEARSAWSQCSATSLSILISGRFRIFFEDREELLAAQGDYVLWGPGVPHTWRAEEASVILTVRWPSRPQT